MWHALGTCQTNLKKFLIYTIPTASGQSGCPIIKNKEEKQFVIGVHIGENGDFKRNVAVRLTREKRVRINEWVGEITNKLDLSKLGFI